MNKKLIGVGIVGIVLLGIFFSPFAQKKLKGALDERALLKGRAVSELALEEQVALFEVYGQSEQTKKLIALSKVLAPLAKEIDPVKRILIAGSVGKEYQRQKLYEHEFEAYEDFLSFYGGLPFKHLYRSESFKKRGDEGLQEVELIQALKFAENERVIALIQSELKSLKNAA